MREHLLIVVILGWLPFAQPAVASPLSGWKSTKITLVADWLSGDRTSVRRGIEKLVLLAEAECNSRPEEDTCRAYADLTNTAADLATGEGDEALALKYLDANAKAHSRVAQFEDETFGSISTTAADFANTEKLFIANGISDAMRATVTRSLKNRQANDIEWRNYYRFNVLFYRAASSGEFADAMNLALDLENKLKPDCDFSTSACDGSDYLGKATDMAIILGQNAKALSLWRRYGAAKKASYPNCEPCHAYWEKRMSSIADGTEPPVETSELKRLYVRELKFYEALYGSP